MSDEQIKGWDYEPEYGSDDWASRRGYEIATAYDDSHEMRMAQADEIADELRKLRDSLLVRIAELGVKIGDRDRLIAELRMEVQRLHKGESDAENS